MHGRNWMALALLAPGSRTSSTNASGAAAGQERRRAARVPVQPRRPAGSSELGAGGQPRFSQDSIAEFQFITNRFDATQGRSTGVQVNAITKSGTNQFYGSVPRQLPRQPLQRRRSGRAHGSCRSATSSTARPSAVRCSRTSCTTSATSSTSGSRRPASGRRRTRCSTSR